MGRATPRHVIEHWDDEREQDNGIIVTLRYGWSFESNEHRGVKGFDTLTEAKAATRVSHLFPCACSECRQHTQLKVQS